MLDVDAAEAAFAKATAIGPPPGPSWERSYEIAQRIIRAKRFVDEEPDRAPLRLAYGMALGDFGLFRDCFIQLHTARRLAPTDPEADYWMGRYLIAQGRPSKAIFAFERALEIDPQHVRALRGMAEAKFLEHEIGDATQFLAQAVQLDPTDPTSRYNLACLLSLTGDAESALSELEAAIDLGYSNWDNVLHDPDLELARTLPRYQQLRERAPTGVDP
jgi:tetratricopeptide (TPR) repeat protein